MNNTTQPPVALEVICFDFDNETTADNSTLSTALMTIDYSRLAFLTITLNKLNREKDILAIVIERVRQGLKPRHITIRCSAPDNGEIPQSLLSLHQHCQQNNVSLMVDFILSDTADGLIALAGIPSQFSNVLAMSRHLVLKQFEVRWLVPLTKPLVYRLEGLFSLARDEGVEPFLLRPNSAVFFQKMTPDERLFVHDFITYRVLGVDGNLLSVRKESYYRDFLFSLNDQNHEPSPTSVLTLFFSSSARNWKLQEKVTYLSSKQLTFPNENRQTGNFVQKCIGMYRDISDVLINGGLAHAYRLSVRDCKIRKPLAGKTFKKVMLIGAYGGEHIGDAAILGGVLCRIHERYGTVEGVLMTQRLNHTRHLIPMLDVPVKVSADIYERPQIKRYVADTDCVVFAGGPLIDLPKQLMRHLYTVSLACKMGKPFIVEGIGPGPFARSPSLFTARQILRLADTISLRASDSVEHELVRDLAVDVGLCPAFDYLKTRQSKLTRLPNDERTSIDELLQGTKGRPIIGVNIRPIGHLYTVGAPEGDAAAYTRRIEHRFEQRFSDGLQSFHQNSKLKPCFVFFPMNAIQFGMSDLLSAYRIQRMLGPGADFRVWQADVSLDGILALLRRVDIAITMRFHAAIFALSQDCKVIGIDYRIGMKDKIAGLLEDVGHGEDCARIDLLTARWLAEKLANLHQSNETEN